MLRVITGDNVQGVQNRYKGTFQAELAQPKPWGDTWEYVRLSPVASKANMTWARSMVKALLHKYSFVTCAQIP